jgi:hypothetical protein
MAPPKYRSASGRWASTADNYHRGQKSSNAALGRRWKTAPSALGFTRSKLSASTHRARRIHPACRARNNAVEPGAVVVDVDDGIPVMPTPVQRAGCRWSRYKRSRHRPAGFRRSELGIGERPARSLPRPSRRALPVCGDHADAGNMHGGHGALRKLPANGLYYPWVISIAPPRNANAGGPSNTGDKQHGMHRHLLPDPSPWMPFENRAARDEKREAVLRTAVQRSSSRVITASR